MRPDKQKAARRALLKEKLRQHLRTDFRHPPVQLRFPETATRPDSKQQQSQQALRSDIEAISRSFTWLETKKQRESWQKYSDEDRSRLDDLLKELKEMEGRVNRALLASGRFMLDVSVCVLSHSG